MDGTEEYYAKWNKSCSEIQIPYDHTYKRNLMNKTKQNKTKQKKSKIEPEAWKQGTDWQWPEGRGQRRATGKIGKTVTEQQ